MNWPGKRRELLLIFHLIFTQIQQIFIISSFDVENRIHKHAFGIFFSYRAHKQTHTYTQTKLDYYTTPWRR